MQFHKKIKIIIEKEMGFGPISSYKDYSILELGMDYLDVAEMIVLIERKFDIKFPENFNLEKTTVISIINRTRQEMFLITQKVN